MIVRIATGTLKPHWSRAGVRPAPVEPDRDFFRLQKPALRNLCFYSCFDAWRRTPRLAPDGAVAPDQAPDGAVAPDVRLQDGWSRTGAGQHWTKECAREPRFWGLYPMRSTM